MFRSLLKLEHIDYRTNNHDAPLFCNIEPSISFADWGFMGKKEGQQDYWCLQAHVQVCVHVSTCGQAHLHSPVHTPVHVQAYMQDRKTDYFPSKAKLLGKIGVLLVAQSGHQVW